MTTHRIGTGRPAARRDRRVSSDAGMAVLGVVLFGAALVLLTAAVTARGTAQFGNTKTDRHWENALAAAESGLNWGLAAVESDDAYTTDDTVPPEILGTSEERGWAVSVAESRDSAFVIPMSVGEFVVVKPSNAAFVYSVGYAPSRDAPDRRVRVVRSGYELVPTTEEWVAHLAVLTQANLEVKGNPSFYTGTGVGIHTNAFLTATGSTYTDGCMSASNGASMQGAVTQGAGCPPPGNQPPFAVPIIDPAGRWHTSTHDLCPDGAVRAGPAHATAGHTVGLQPCTGQVLEANANANPYNGWRFNDPAVSELWRYNTTTAHDGVYYVHHASAVVSASPGSTSIPWPATIIASASGTCPNALGGDIRISGSPKFAPHPEGGNLLLISGRDIQITGNPDMTGIVGAREQISVTGTATVTNGSYVAGGGCHSTGSPVSENYMGGNVSVANNGSVESELYTATDMLMLVNWTELTGG
jgi:hypothetical protein